MCYEVKNNRVFIDGKAMNEYVCDVCGERVSDLRCEDVFGEEKHICSECNEDLENLSDRTEELYLVYYNDYGSVKRFAEDYQLTVAVAMVIINEGRKINHSMISPTEEI